MSFPPSRPPMGMPGMMPQGYGYTPVAGMMPMGMGVMPGGMIRPSMSSSSTSSSTTTTTSKSSKKLVPQEIPKDEKEDKPPVTTAFVGNISERAPDAMVRQMLQRCGNVLSWKRVQGASGKLQAFGFCEYEDPEATLRCIRLLNEWQIADKTLVVKVDPKTKTLLEDYKKKKRAREGNGTSETRNGEKDKEKDKDRESADEDREDGHFGPDGLDEFTMREDRVATAGLDAIMREYSKDLEKEPALGEPSAEEKKEKRKEQRKEKKDEVKDAGLDDMELEEEKKDLINREIQSFRDAHKGEEEKEAERNRERERRRREEERERERRERERERERREKEREIERKQRERERTRSRTRSRSRDRYVDRERERHDRERERELEDEEEAYERRKIEKKLREKEAAYQERLKNWEARERKKTREYEKEREKEEERKMEEAREARRLKEFLEDYDDERDDPKYYKGSALQRRLKEREKEMEADARDRQREKEEIDEIRRRLLEEGHPNLEEQMARIERERDEHLMPRLHTASSPAHSSPSPPPPVEAPPPSIPAPPHPVAAPTPPEPEKRMLPLQPVDPLPADLPPDIRPLPTHSISSHSSPESDGMEPLPEAGGYSEDSASLPFIGPATREDQQKAKMGFSAIKLGRASDSPSDTKNKRKKLTVGDVFNQDDDDTIDGPKKRKLEPLDYSQEEQAAVSSKNNSGSDIPNRPTTAEEKRKCIKMLIEKIPTAKEELFAYQLDWNMVDTTLMDRRIKPWVNKKIVEYIGEEEPTLTDFICQKVMLHSPPQVILNDVAMVLDEEAEVFVVKMWRLLIYETEAKKAGLVK